MFVGWRFKKYDPDQPRDENGQFASSGGGSGGDSAHTKESLSKLTDDQLSSAQDQLGKAFQDTFSDPANYADATKARVLNEFFSNQRALIDEENKARADHKEHVIREYRKAQPTPSTDSVKEAFDRPATFGKVNESDSLWQAAPHGTQPILDAAREAGFSDPTIRHVLNALKGQGWSGKSELDSDSSVAKIAAGHYGTAEQSLLAAIADRESRSEGLNDRTYYRKGTFSGQPVVSTTRDQGGASMAVGQGEFESIGWNKKRTGAEMLSEGYKPLGETFIQGYIDEKETLWVKFPKAKV